MIRGPPGTTRTDPRCPYTTLFRSDPQIDDEPQMLQRRQNDPFKRAETEIVRGPEGTETLRIAVLRHQFDPRLRRNDDNDPEGERDQQPRAPRLCERPRSAELRHQSRTRIARDEEQQGQSPAVGRVQERKSVGVGKGCVRTCRSWWLPDS